MSQTDKPHKIYLDNQSTTAVDPRVMQVMLPYFTDYYGNAASRNHAFGWAAADAVEIAREKVAKLIHCRPAEIIFTSGATEANNLAITGLAQNKQNLKKDHIVTIKTEHKAVLDTCQMLEKDGFTVSYLDVNPDGVLNISKLTDAITDRTLLVSVMHANNEIGIIQPIAEIARICAERQVVFHTDGAQSVSKIPVDFSAWGIELMSMSAHKMYGPKGIGALAIRRKNPAIRLKPIQYGGGHERGLRSGTLPVPLIVGFGAACELALNEMAEESRRAAKLRDMLLSGITSELDGITVNGSMIDRLPGNLNLSFTNINAEALIMGMPEIAISSGSACTSSSPEPTYVLKALGLSDDQSYSSVRFGIGRFTTEAEITTVISRIVETVKRLRQ
ncbi:MAG: aminotransferase class V-fold PLP-dependent enzyme [Candidatus Marinimicrobia bacterium]|nr:aminotransferase class V-fold PLP-dependent enzyme [Candidatus Neomarinimicrobiota bacterium]